MTEKSANPPVAFRLPFPVIVKPEAASVPITPSKKEEAAMPDKRNKTDRIGLILPFARGGFFLILGATILGAYLFGFIPMWASEVIARYWGFVCLGYLALVVIPLFAPFATGEKEFVIDRYSWIALVIEVIALTAVLLYLNIALSDAWLIMGMSYLTVIVDGMTLGVLLSLRKEFRKTAS